MQRSKAIYGWYYWINCELDLLSSSINTGDYFIDSIKYKDS